MGWKHQSQDHPLTNLMNPRRPRPYQKARSKDFCHTPALINKPTTKKIDGEPVPDFIESENIPKRLLRRNYGMSILQRYRKRGGFLKLLQLIETSPPKKRNQLLKVIEAEDRNWADNIREKSLSFEKFCSWRAETQFLILSHITKQYRFLVYKRLPENIFENITGMMGHIELADFNQEYQHVKEPLEGEFLSAQAHLFEIIRELNEENVIVLSQIDPQLQLPDAA